ELVQSHLVAGGENELRPGAPEPAGDVRPEPGRCAGQKHHLPAQLHAAIIWVPNRRDPPSSCEAFRFGVFASKVTEFSCLQGVFVSKNAESTARGCSQPAAMARPRVPSPADGQRVRSV